MGPDITEETVSVIIPSISVYTSVTIKGPSWQTYIIVQTDLSLGEGDKRYMPACDDGLVSVISLRHIIWSAEVLSLGSDE